MFDNFGIEKLYEVVEMVGGKYEMEVFGGIICDILRMYVEIGVDFIFVGVFIYFYKSFDFSLKVIFDYN